MHSWRGDSDLRRTLASLQHEYDSTLKSLQLDSVVGLPGEPKSESGVLLQYASLSSGQDSSSGGSCTGINRPAFMQPQAAHQQYHPAPKAAPCKSAATCKRRCASAGGGCAAQHHPARPSVTDPRLTMLGLRADDFTAAAVHGSSLAIDLSTEPLAVLRDVLNLDGSRDQDRAQQHLQQQQPSAGTSAATSDPAGEERPSRFTLWTRECARPEATMSPRAGSSPLIAATGYAWAKPAAPIQLPSSRSSMAFSALPQRVPIGPSLGTLRCAVRY